MQQSNFKEGNSLIQSATEPEGDPNAIVGSVSSETRLTDAHSSAAGPVEETHSSVDEIAFEPGHVFEREDLPENKSYLAGALYVADNPDGTMFTLSAEQFHNDFDTWSELKSIINGINQKENNVRFISNKDWNRIFSSDFVENARLDMYASFPRNVYWGDDHDVYRPEKANIRFPYEINKDSRADLYPKEQLKNALARGRFVSDEAKFWEPS